MKTETKLLIGCGVAVVVIVVVTVCAVAGVFSANPAGAAECHADADCGAGKVCGDDGRCISEIGGGPAMASANNSAAADNGALPLCGARVNMTLVGDMDASGRAFSGDEIYGRGASQMRREYTLLDTTQGAALHDQNAAASDLRALDDKYLYAVAVALRYSDFFRPRPAGAERGPDWDRFGSVYYGPIVTVRATLRGGRGTVTLARQQPPYEPNGGRPSLIIDVAPVAYRDLERVTLTVDMTPSATHDSIPQGQRPRVTPQYFALNFTDEPNCRARARMWLAPGNPSYMPQGN